MIDYSEAYISKDTLCIYQPDELQDMFEQWARGVASREGDELKLELSDYIELEHLVPCNQFQIVHEEGYFLDWSAICESFQNELDDGSIDIEECPTVAEYIGMLTWKNSACMLIDDLVELSGNYSGWYLITCHNSAWSHKLITNGQGEIHYLTDKGD